MQFSVKALSLKLYYELYFKMRIDSCIWVSFYLKFGEIFKTMMFDNSCKSLVCGEDFEKKVLSQLTQ